MKYRNTVTGAEIETYGAISGGNWVEVKASPASEPSVTKKKPKDNAGRKKATAGE